MRIARTILALFISFAVAILPAAGGAASLMASPPDQAASQPVHVHASDAAAHPMAMSESMDCCDHQRMPCDQGNDCASALMCALHCFNFTPVEGSVIVLPLTAATRILPLAERAVLSATSAPPFRPPRA